LVDKFQKHLNINSIYSEIPSSDIDKSDKKNWLRDIMQLDIDYLPEEVLKWKNNLVDDCLNLSKDTIVFTHFMVINALVGSLLKNNVLMYFYPNYVSVTKITFENKEVKSISLGDEKKTIINL
jgi:broad specificity phosphatase PhoE